MSRRLCFIVAASLSLAGYNLAPGQDTPTTDAPASSVDDVASLQAENASLKKEVADAKRTIAELQSQLAQAGQTHEAATPESTPGMTDPNATNGTPTGPLKALPLDAPNPNATASTPDAAAGPTRTYTVVKGDKLWTIAKRMYPGHTKDGVDKIQEANKDALGNKPLKIGQVLIIPQ